MKICIERSDRMGDMILTLPVIQGIKEQNPNAIVHVVTSQKNSKICKKFSLIDKTYEKSTSSSGTSASIESCTSANIFDFIF